MRIVISSGHGKYIRGASGNPVPPQCDEVDEARKVVDRVTEMLGEMGVEVTKFHDDVSNDQNENLNRIVNFHNAQTRDWDVSVHFNASEDHTGHGVEVLYVSSTGETMATKVSKAISDASGLTNRGPKYRDNLFFLNSTEAPAVLIETAFCDNTSDCNTYQDKFEEICEAIAESLSGQEVEERPPLPERPERPVSENDAICDIAMASAIADYSWKDRGIAPPGYIQGFALAWAQVIQRYLYGDDVASEMGKANTSSDTDVLQVYRDEFHDLGMTNEYSDIHTLRHLFALLLGLGMRESSGKHCEGRDTTATNVTSDTAEAGLYQTSYNAHNFCDEFDTIMDEYMAGRNEGYMEVFARGVICSDSDWQDYGSGAGREFQRLCKEEPAFAVETCALTLRNRCDHYGPINRKEAELKREADEMLFEVQRYVEDKWVA